MTRLTEAELADLRRRDADWDQDFTGADWRAVDVLRDRRRLLAELDAVYGLVKVDRRSLGGTSGTRPPPPPPSDRG